MVECEMTCDYEHKGLSGFLPFNNIGNNIEYTFVFNYPHAQAFVGNTGFELIAKAWRAMIKNGFHKLKADIFDS